MLSLTSINIIYESKKIKQKVNIRNLTNWVFNVFTSNDIYKHIETKKEN